MKDKKLAYALIILAFLGMSSLFYSLRNILPPFIIAFTIAYALNIPVSLLERRGIPRGFGSAILIFSFLSLIGFISFLTLPFIERQLVSLAQGFPSWIEKATIKVSPWIESLSKDYHFSDIQQLREQLFHYLGSSMEIAAKFLANIASNGLALANMLAFIFLIPVISFYLLKDWPRMVKKIKQLFPKPYEEKISHTLEEIHKSLAYYIKGQGQVCLILMVLYSVALSVVHLPQSILVGCLTGFLSFIPYAGAIIGLLTSMAIAFGAFDSLQPIISIFGIFVVIGFVEGNYLSPRFIGEKLGIHPVWIIFSLLASGTFLGIMGVLLVFPMAAILSVVTRTLVDTYVKSSFYKDGL